MGEESPCYSKLNCKGISPPWIPLGSLTTKSALRVCSVIFNPYGLEGIDTDWGRFWLTRDWNPLNPPQSIWIGVEPNKPSGGIETVTKYLELYLLLLLVVCISSLSMLLTQSHDSIGYLLSIVYSWVMRERGYILLIFLIVLFYNVQSY